MRWQFSPYLTPVIIAAAISIILAVLLWRRRSRPGATSLMVMMLAVTRWLLGYAIEMASIDPGTKIIWHTIEFVGFTLVPTCWLIFALEFTGKKKWLKFRWLALWFVEPLLMSILVATNEFHELIWRSDSASFHRFTGLHLENGILYWFHIIYATILILVGTILILVFLVRGWQYYQRQAVVLIIGLLIPWIGILLDIFDLNPFYPPSLTPIAFALAGVLITWGILRYQLLDIIPVAREAIFEQMMYGVVVLDLQDRIVDLN
jgi:hypothetical protein